MSERRISVSHLVFSLIFLGAAALWAIGAATNADTPDLAVVAPAVLIVAGVVGLIAIAVNARNARISAEKALGPGTTHTEYADTGIHDHEERP